MNRLLIEHKWYFNKTHKGKSPVIFQGVFESEQAFQERKGVWYRQTPTLDNVTYEIIREVPEEEYTAYIERLWGK